MVPPLKVLKIKDQKGKVYVPNLGIEITVIDTDPKGLYIVGKNDQGETICVDSIDCELIKDNNIENNNKDNITNTNTNTNAITNINNKISNNTNKKEPVNNTNNTTDEKNKVKTKKFGSKFRKK
jgi:hypothetical protein